MPMWNKMYLQNSNSPLMEHLSFFHDHSMLLICSITSLSFSMINSSINMKNFNHFMLESHETELFWTTIPALMLIFIAVPSLKTLYMMEENMSTLITIKTMGYQWYWSYDYSNLHPNKKIMSMMNNFSLKMRSSSTLNNLVIPTLTPTRMLITSKDVLHSWAIPSLGLKSDATPGRMNQILFSVKRPNIMVGQCSEICGAGHSFMPIYMESPNMKNFLMMKMYFM